MTRPIQLKGFKINKGGRVERDPRRLSVSERLKQQSRNSKRVRIARRTPRT